MWVQGEEACTVGGVKMQGEGDSQSWRDLEGLKGVREGNLGGGLWKGTLEGGLWKGTKEEGPEEGDSGRGLLEGGLTGDSGR